MLSFVIYFLPTIIALLFCESKQLKLTVFLINFLLGWTIVGWIVALIMSVANADD